MRIIPDINPIVVYSLKMRLAEGNLLTGGELEPIDGSTGKQQMGGLQALNSLSILGEIEAEQELLREVCVPVADQAGPSEAESEWFVDSNGSIKLFYKKELLEKCNEAKLVRNAFSVLRTKLREKAKSERWMELYLQREELF